MQVQDQVKVKFKDSLSGIGIAVVGVDGVFSVSFINLVIFGVIDYLISLILVVKTTGGRFPHP